MRLLRRSYTTDERRARGADVYPPLPTLRPPHRLVFADVPSTPNIVLAVAPPTAYNQALRTRGKRPP
jgi:hypothetical protein